VDLADELVDPDDLTGPTAIGVTRGDRSRQTTLLDEPSDDDDAFADTDELVDFDDPTVPEQRRPDLTPSPGFDTREMVACERSLRRRALRRRVVDLVGLTGETVLARLPRGLRPGRGARVAAGLSVLTAALLAGLLVAGAIV
jgi:hypothetical protein